MHVCVPVHTCVHVCTLVYTHNSHALGAGSRQLALPVVAVNEARRALGAVGDAGEARLGEVREVELPAAFGGCFLAVLCKGERGVMGCWLQRKH